MNNDIDIAELKRLHSAATGGEITVDAFTDLITDKGTRLYFSGIVTPLTHGPAQQEAKANAREYAALHNAFPALIARLEAAEAAMQWRPIEEAPKDGKTRILGCGLYNHPFDPAMAESVVFAWVHFNRILGEWVDCHGYYFTPTHYMPLPAPPEAAR